MLDTIVDVGFILYDVGNIIYTASTGRGVTGTQVAALGADVAGLFIPFATGGGVVVRAGVKGMGHSDDLARLGNKLKNQFSHLDKKHLDAAARENAGEVVARRADGTPYDHAREVAEARQGATNAIDELKEMVNDPRLTPEKRAAAQEMLSQYSKQLDMVEDKLEALQQQKPRTPHL